MAAGGLAFPEFLAHALYAADGGYYARPGSRVGRAGDFFTSVSVGPLFGGLLARRFLRWRREAAVGGRWRILEIGANNGALAADVLAAIESLDPAAAAALEYAIAEPLAGPRAAQARTLADHAARIRHVARPAELAEDPLPGIAFGNELLDALAFHIVTRRGGCWHESGVAAADDGASLEWCDLGPAARDPALAAALAPVDASGLADGYRTEVRTNFTALHREIATAMVDAHVVWIDYGYSRDDYFHPARTTGTLRTYRRHTAGEDPLAAPGEADITAHVDFTALVEQAAAAGFGLAGFSTQGAWLVDEARDWLAGHDGKPPEPAVARQFQSLTHPGHFGARFHVVELAMGTPTANAASVRRLGLVDAPSPA